jgi:hypothetical protein
LTNPPSCGFLHPEATQSRYRGRFRYHENGGPTQREVHIRHDLID